jgi:pyridinium-3,5-biscarboxylic acid mononucleotide synthase
MTSKKLLDIFEGIQSGSLSIEDAIASYATAPFQDLGFAKLDHHRLFRSGASEVIFGEGKSAEQIVVLAEALLSKNQNVLVTRIADDHARAMTEVFEDATWNPTSRTLSICREPVSPSGRVGVLSAGTADGPVADEATHCASFWGMEVLRFSDVGVAGLHRLLAILEEIRTLPVLIVVAGMDGALPSVVAGLVDMPVIAVPTSVGYGACFSGIAPLLANLNACAEGVTVVNIDNGFGAARAAHRILSQLESTKPVPSEAAT